MQTFNLGKDIITKSLYIQDIISGFEEDPIGKNIDTVRGIITQKALAKIKNKFNLKDCIFDNKDQSYVFKIDTAFLKVFSLTAPKNAKALELCTKQRKSLTHFVYIELFGLSQFKQNGEWIEPTKELKKLMDKLINQDNLKRRWFYPTALDYAIDYKLNNKNEIEKGASILTLQAILLDNIEQDQSIIKDGFAYAGNYYIQHNNKENIAPHLEKILIYDKSKKDAIKLQDDKVLYRVEFTINHDHDYFRDSYKNYHLQDVFSMFRSLENSNNINQLERLKKRYPKAYKKYKEFQDDPLNAIC